MFKYGNDMIIIADNKEKVLDYLHKRQIEGLFIEKIGVQLE